MKRSLVNSIALTSAASMPALANAHTGHDHGHWSSDAVHLVLAAVIVSAAIYGVITGVKMWKQLSSGI